jgi:crotonobetainyl-CoA:carnitine CoA-transferase CaiB-like acyl-CoA transferase
MNQNLLKNIRVIDLTTHIAAPACTRIMADWGADVIKVEGPEGDAWRTFGATVGVPVNENENPLWQMENANKKAIALNLKKPEGLEIMLKLIASADVFVSNVRLASLKKLGLDYETLSARFPKLVWSHVSGYGLYGDESTRPGYDIVAFWARGGMMGDIPPEGNPPITVPTGVGDHITSLALLSGICGALLKAKETGKGEKICTSLYNTAIYVNNTMITSTQYDDVYPKSRYAPSTPLMNSYKTKDGEWLTLALLAYNSTVNRLFKILELEHLIGDDRYNSLDGVKKNGNTEVLCRILEDAFVKFNCAYLVEQMTANDLTFERCRHFKEISKDPQAHANNYFNHFKFPSGNTAQLAASPVQFSTNEPLPCGLAPALGQHNHEILISLGFSDEQIKAMQTTGAVVSL